MNQGLQSRLTGAGKLAGQVVVAGIVLAAARHAAAAEAGGMASPHTYYVDSAGGDDARDGLTPAAAWRSLLQVNQASLRPSDRVLFRRGGTWRGQLVPKSGTVDGVVTYGVYGDGAKPLLLGSVAMNHPEDWKPAGEGVWQTAPFSFDPVSVQADLQHVHWSLYQEGGAVCTMSTVPGAGASEYRIDCTQSGALANHLQLSAPGLTVEAGQYYLVTFRLRSTIPFSLKSVVLIKGGAPWTSYAGAESAPIAVDADEVEHTIRFHATQSASDGRLTFYLGGSIPAGASLYLQPGQMVRALCSQPTPLDVDVGNIIFDDGQSTGVKKWSIGDLHDDGDFYYDPATWQVKLQSRSNPAARWHSLELALRRHIIDEGGKGYVTYEGLALRYGAAHGIGGASTQHITARDCDLSFIGGGHQMTRPGGNPVRFGNGIEFWANAHDCLVEGCRLWEIYDAALTNQGDGTNVQENITYRRNVIWNSEYSFEFWNRGPASHTRNIVFEHNTCVDAGAGWGHRQRPDPNGRHLMFWDNTSVTEHVVVRNNIFCNAVDSLLRFTGADWTAALAMDGNCWYQAQGPMVLWHTQKVSAEEFAAFEHQRGLDAHSIVGDPQFIDPAHHDYHLAVGSPARQIGPAGPAGALE